MNGNFDGFDFWDDSPYADEHYTDAAPSDQLIAEIEQELGYRLPDSYIRLMRQRNGGIPKHTDFPAKTKTGWADDRMAISGIMGIGRSKRYSLCGEMGSQFMIDEWGYPPIGVAICHCPSGGHDMVFLDYRACGNQGEPKVVHIAQEYGYRITPLADNFEQFIRGLYTAYLDIERICADQVVCHGFLLGKSRSAAEIPADVTELDIGAFHGCEALETIILPEQLNGALNDTFSECIRLRRITVPAGITEIGENTFSYCENLEAVTIPDTVKRIDTSAFQKCSRLETVRLPEDVRFIWDDAYETVLFGNCPALHTLTVGDRVFSFDSQRFQQLTDTEKEWTDTEIKAALVLCCTAKNPADSRPVYETASEKR